MVLLALPQRPSKQGPRLAEATVPAWRGATAHLCRRVGGELPRTGEARAAGLLGPGVDSRRVSEGRCCHSVWARPMYSPMKRQDSGTSAPADRV